ncbi:MAG: PorV/PorQ family protein [bacterium]|nr:PorV/PorQ family protein [bacterium]
MKRFVPTLLFIALPVYSLLAEGSAGQTGFEFLRIDVPARQTALGGAFTAMDGDLNGLACNPASLAIIPKREAAFSYVDYFLDFQLGSLSFSSPLRNGATLGLGIGYANYGEFEWTDEDGGPIGSSTPGDVAVTLAYAAGWNRTTRFGASVRYIRSSIQNYSADAAVVGAGVIRIFPSQQMTVGLAVVNLGRGLSGFRDRVEKVPTSFRAGFTKRLAHLPLLLSVDAIQYTGAAGSTLGNTEIAAGGEFAFSGVLVGRFGYTSVGSGQKTGPSGGRLSGVSLGAGLTVRQFRIDYGYGNHGMLGSVNHLGVSLAY